MPEHRIRLRGAWDLFEGPGGPEAGRRVTLPARWPIGLGGPVRLIRRFGPPPIDPTIEAISLELLGVPGLRRVELNGAELPLAEAGGVDRVVPLPAPLLARNTLTLDVEVGPSSRLERADEWGAIALLITQRAGDPGASL